MLPGAVRRRSAGPRAPQYLRPATRRWWSEVVADFELESHHQRLLTLAAEALDRREQAREELAKSGAYFDDRFGKPRVHPAVAVERDSGIAFARLMRELDLDVEPPRESRPPGIGR